MLVVDTDDETIPKSLQLIAGRTAQEYNIRKTRKGALWEDRMKLVILDSATSINDLKIPPGNRIEELKDNRKGQHSIRINNQWRICFEWKMVILSM